MRFSLRQHRRFLFFVGTLTILLFLLIGFQKTRPVIAVMDRFRTGLSSAGNGIGIVIEHLFYSKAELVNENERLTKELQALALNAAGVASLQDENASLSALLDFVHRTSYRPIVASVMSRAEDLDGEAILIDRGRADGINEGSAVVAENGFLVGIIMDVRESSAVARLVTDQMSKVGVRMQNGEQTIGIAEGQNGELLKIDFIPQSVELNVNDLIVTSGLDAGIPPGLVVGISVETVRDEHNPFQQAFIQPLVDMRHLTTVGVIQLGSL